MSFASVVTALSPYAWFRCNEVSGTVLTDSSGNSRNGSIVGPVTYQNTGYTNDGNHSLGTITTATALGLDLPTGSTTPGNATTAFTLGFIWKPGAYGTGSYYLAGAENGDLTHFWQLIIGSGNNLQLSVNSSLVGTQPTLASLGISPNGGPVIIWVTYDGASNWAVYLNGNTAPSISGAAALTQNGSVYTLVVANYNNSGNLSSVGFYQDIMLFSSVLNQANRQSVNSASGIITQVTQGVTTTTNLPAKINVTWSSANGGTAPFTYKLYRSLTISNSTVGQTLLYTGTATSFLDTPPTADPYYYIVTATDSAATPASIQFLAVPGQIGASVLLCCIGDSRTFGVNSTTGGDVVTQLGRIVSAGLGNGQVTTVNKGVSGSNTSQWIPGATNYTTALAAFQSAAAAMPTPSKVFVQIALGVNDASNGTVTSMVPVANVIANLTATINGIKSANIPQLAGIILHQSFYCIPYLYPQTNPVPFNEATNNLVIQYNAAMLSLVDNVTVFAGETSSYNYFAANSAQLLNIDGVHPGNAGYTAWANLMAQPILNLLGVATRAPGTIAPLPQFGPSHAFANQVFNYGGVTYNISDPVTDPNFTLINADPFYGKKITHG